MRRKIMATVTAAALALGGALLVQGSAEAALWANCSGQILRNGAGQSAPRISCTTVGPRSEARGKLDCTAAPDTATAWVRAYQSSTGGFCLFGARGYSYEVRGY